MFAWFSRFNYVLKINKSSEQKNSNQPKSVTGLNRFLTIVLNGESDGELLRAERGDCFEIWHFISRQLNEAFINYNMSTIP